MPKRKAEDKIKRYKEKIKRLEQKRKVHNSRRNVIISDSDPDIENQDIQIPENYNVEIDDNMHHDYPDIQDESLPNDCESSQTLNAPPEQEQVPGTSSEVPTELDPEIRLALGDPIEDNPKYGANILNDLAQRWLPILKKGLTKEVKENLLKEHHIPDNCRLLKSPSLNSCRNSS
uniref:Uncharacterized protein n=1 Tax=Heliothis virescens TaxID=7102 RepID=A0A2A4J384_HELVI